MTSVTREHEPDGIGPTARLTKPSAAHASSHAAAKDDGEAEDDSDVEITTDEYHANGAATNHTAIMPAPRLLSSSVTTPSGLHVDRSSLVRLLTQSLHSLGYPAAAASLERESGVELENREMVKLRRDVLAGRWTRARSRATKMPGVARQARKEVERVLAEQQYLQLLEQSIQERAPPTSAVAGVLAHPNGVSNGAAKVHGGAAASSSHGGPSSAGHPSAAGALVRAVQFLQNEMVPLYGPPSSARSQVSPKAPLPPPPPPHPHILHLASLLTCTSVAGLQAQYRGPGVLPATAPSSSAGTAKAEDVASIYLPLYQRLASLLPTDGGALVPRDHQLLHLLEHSLQAQVAACHFHQENEAMTFNPMKEHQCALRLPSSPLLTLEGHTDEVLCVAFSNPVAHGAAQPLRMATCSADGTVRVWEMRMGGPAAEKGQREGGRTASRPSASQEEEEKKEVGWPNGHAAVASSSSNGHVANGVGAAGSSKASAGGGGAAPSLPPAAGAFDFVCTSTLHAPGAFSSSHPDPGRHSSRESSASNSRRSSLDSSSSSGGGRPGAPFYSVDWSADNEYLLACNGVDAAVFHVQDGLCVMSVGTRAVDHLASAAAEVVHAAARAASGQGSVPMNSATTPTSAPAGAPAASTQTTAANTPSVSRSFSALQALGSPYSPLLLPLSASSAAAAVSAAGSAASAPGASSAATSSSLSAQHAAAIQHVQRLMAHPLLQSMRASSGHAAGGGGGVLSHVELQARMDAAAAPHHAHHHPSGGDSHASESSNASTSLDHDHLVGHTEPVTCAAWCADGVTFLTGSSDRRLIMWDLSGEIVDVWAGEMITDIAVGAAGHATHGACRMIACTPQNRCIVFQIKDRRMEEISSFTSSVPISSVSLSSDSRYALVSVMRPAEMQLWDLGAIASDEERPGRSTRMDVAASEATAHGNGFAWPPTSNGASGAASAAAPSARLSSTSLPPLLFSPSAPPLPSSPPAAGTLAPSLVRRYSGYHSNRFIVRSCLGGPADHLVLSGSEDGLVYVYHRETAHQLAALRGHTATVNSVDACRHQGRHLFASAADDHTVKVWTIETQAQN